MGHLSTENRQSAGSAYKEPCYLEGWEYSERTGDMPSTCDVSQSDEDVGDFNGVDNICGKSNGGYGSGNSNGGNSNGGNSNGGNSNGGSSSGGSSSGGSSRGGSSNGGSSNGG